jgi:glutathione synthase
MYATYPPQITEEEQKYFIQNFRDYGLSTGFCVKHHDPKIGDCAALAPITLFPSLFPANCYHMAEAVQIPYNNLYAKIASDQKWLEECIQK